MSIFNEMKSLTFSWSVDGQEREAHVRFCDREGRPFVLLSDLWRLSEMGGDQASVVEVYVRSCGLAAAQHFVFRASPPDALVSQKIAERMVRDWCEDKDHVPFRWHPVTTMFEDAHRLMHGLATIRELFERSSDERRLPTFDPIACQLEINLIASAMLAHWGRPGSGFPALGRREAQFLSCLTMSANDAARARKVRTQAVRFFSMYREDAAHRIQPRWPDLHLTSN